MIEKAIIKVITNTSNKPPMKILSAIFSYLVESLSLNVRIDRKEKRQLEINNIHATPVISSIFDTSLSLDIFSEVKTIRQKPSKLEDVFKMCCDLFIPIASVIYVGLK